MHSAPLTPTLFLSRIRTPQPCLRQFNLTFCTVNVLSLQTAQCPQDGRGTLVVGKRAALKEQSLELGVHVVGMQETRFPHSELPAAAHFLMFNSAVEAGRYGCSLWFNKRADWSGEWLSERHCTVSSASPRHLCVQLQCQGERLTFFCGHARICCRYPPLFSGIARIKRSIADLQVPR